MDCGYRPNEVSQILALLFENAVPTVVTTYRPGGRAGGYILYIICCKAQLLVAYEGTCRL